MATIRKKGDHQWHVQIRKKGYPSQTKTFETRSEAERWSKLIESEMDRGVFVSRSEAEATTVYELIDRYTKEILPTKRSSNTDDSRAKTLKEHLGAYKLAALASNRIAKFRDDRLKEVGPQSVIHELNLLNRILKTATMDWGIALPGGLPTALVRNPQKPRGRDRRVSAEEISAIVEASESPDLKAIILIAVETGMRRGEIASLEWSGINLAKRTAYIAVTKTDVPRSAPLSSIAGKLLSGLPRRIVGGAADPKVFSVKPGSISQAFERAVKRARENYLVNCESKGVSPDRQFLVEVRFHDLRHEATSRFFERGLNVMEVAAITGHKTLDMLKRYTHLRAEDLAHKLA